MRIDKFLANMGFGSRKEVKPLLKSGAVRVNGTTIKDPKVHVNAETDKVAVNGEAVRYVEYIYVMLNKPPGVISATEDTRDRTVIDLLGPEERHFNPFPVGRLDKDTEGLLLLTNDGQLAHELLSPKKHVDKTYFARIDGEVTDADIAAFQDGITLEDGYVSKPARLRILSSGPVSEIELTITEGKFHQVKRMFKSTGKEVLYLKRVSMGPLQLDPSLEKGEFRSLTEKEIRLLKQEK